MKITHPVVNPCYSGFTVQVAEEDIREDAAKTDNNVALKAVLLQYLNFTVENRIQHEASVSFDLFSTLATESGE